MSGTRDTNWRSYVGPADNGRTITTAEWQAPDQPKQWDDGLKGSRLKNFTVHGLKIPDFAEDSIDFVQGENYTVRECTLHGSMTVKGAINGLRIENVAISGTLEFGQFDNYWKPNRLPTRNAVIENLNSPRGHRPRVKLWDATVPEIHASDVELIVIPRSVWLPYFLFRYAYLRARAAA